MESFWVLKKIELKNKKNRIFRNYNDIYIYNSRNESVRRNVVIPWWNIHHIHKADMIFHENRKMQEGPSDLNNIIWTLQSCNSYFCIYLDLHICVVYMKLKEKLSYENRQPAETCPYLWVHC